MGSALPMIDRFVDVCDVVASAVDDILFLLLSLLLLAAVVVSRLVVVRLVKSLLENSLNVYNDEDEARLVAMNLARRKSHLWRK